MRRRGPGVLVVVFIPVLVLARIRVGAAVRILESGATFGENTNEINGHDKVSADKEAVKPAAVLASSPDAVGVSATQASPAQRRLLARTRRAYRLSWLKEGPLVTPGGRTLRGLVRSPVRSML